VTIFLTVLHVMVCLVLIVVVLLQHGKGADIGAVFGGGASSTVFGSRGAGNFLTRLTTGAALVFMVTSLWLSYLANTGPSRSIFEEESPPAASEPAPSQAPGEAKAPEGQAPAQGGFEEVKPPAKAEPPQAGAPEAKKAPAPAPAPAGKAQP
jgi:preprotein translocase subunit SecG